MMSVKNQISGFVQFSDEYLLELFDNGDVNAFNEIVERYRNKVGDYLFKYTNDEHDTKDILQECFIKVYNLKGRLKEIKRFSIWFYVIAINNAKSRFKKKKEFVNVSIEDMNEDDFSGSQFIDTFAEEFSNLSSEEFTKSLASALEKLEDVFKEVILLRYLEGFEYEKISALLSIPVGTVKSRINRGRERMKALMNINF